MLTPNCHLLRNVVRHFHRFRCLLVDGDPFPLLSLLLQLGFWRCSDHPELGIVTPVSARGEIGNEAEKVEEKGKKMEAG